MISPLFLFGFARSGTTLLTMMVGAHPEISAPLSVAGLWYETESRLTDYNNLKTRSDIRRLLDDLISHERIRLWKTKFDREVLSEQIRQGAYADVVQVFHRAQAQAEGKSRWANMDIATLNYIERAAQWFNDAKFIHIVRDGRDVALSHQTMNFRQGNFLEIALSWSSSVEAARRIGTVLGPNRSLIIRYEDLILDPQTTLQSLCDFVGVAFDTRMLDYRDHVAMKVPAQKRYLWPYLNKPPQSNRVGYWRREMTAAQRYVFEEHASAALRSMGYETAEKCGFSLQGELYAAWQHFGRGRRVDRLMSRIGITRKSQLERAWLKPTAFGSSGTGTQESASISAFGSSIESRVCAVSRTHAPQFRKLFRFGLEQALTRVGLLDRTIRVLEVGCGAGAWIHELLALFTETDRDVKLYGSDLSGKMIELCRTRFSGILPIERFFVGNILDDAAYGGMDNRYDLILAYDVIQQLPPNRHFDALQSLRARLDLGGVAVVFDNEARSDYGRRMARKKFLTRWFYLPLVPRYYCNAHYPSLGRLAARLHSAGARTTLIQCDGLHKYVLIVQNNAVPGCGRRLPEYVDVA